MFKRMLMLLPCLAAAKGAIAMPVLSPADPSITPKSVFMKELTDFFSFRVGFRGDYVYNRHLEDGDHTIDRYSLFANEGVLTLNFFDRIDLYGMVGAVSQSYASKFNGVGVLNIKDTFDTVTIWGTGAKVILWQSYWRNLPGSTFLTGSFDYEITNTAEPKLSTSGTGGSETLAPPLPHYRYQELQAALTIGHRIQKLVPYIGVKWTNAIVSLQTPPFIPLFMGFRSQSHFGYVVGASLVDVARMTVTAEARFVDEKAMTITGAFRF